MEWLKCNWDKLLQAAAIVFGAGGIAAFFEDFWLMCSSYPWQAAFLAALSFGIGIQFARVTSARSRRRRRLHDLVKSVPYLAERQRGILAIALSRGEIWAQQEVIGIGHGLCSDGYLDLKYSGGTRGDCFTMPNDVRAAIMSSESACKAIKDGEKSIEDSWGYRPV